MSPAEIVQFCRSRCELALYVSEMRKRSIIHERKRGESERKREVKTERERERERGESERKREVKTER